MSDNVLNHSQAALAVASLAAEENLEVSPAQQPIEDQSDGCERCGSEHQWSEAEPICFECREFVDTHGESPEASYEGPEDVDVNDGFHVIRGEPNGAPQRRTWAAKEPLKSKKRVLYQGEEDMFSESESSDGDSVDDDTPDLLGYLGDFPGLTGITKISMLRAAANYLSSQQRATKPFQTPVKAPEKITVPARPQKKGKNFITKRAR